MRLTISGFTVPALSTRKAETEFELQDGQSFVIAGLLDNRVTDLYNKIPGMGDIPILGNFFKSKSAQKSNSELMVLCTARRVAPSTSLQPLPVITQPFLDKDKFDDKKPSERINKELADDQPSRSGQIVIEWERGNARTFSRNRRPGQ